MENLWPTIDNIEETKDVLPFLEETIDSLKTNYEGKINAKISKIEYLLKKTRNILSSFNDLSTLLEQQTTKDEYEERMDVEKNRDIAYVTNNSYKYEIYNDHLYYKLFTIDIPEFYPVELHVSGGILGNDEDKIIINNISELRSTFLQIACSDRVRMIIKKMVK